jgi:hypothetical protein
MSWSALVGRAVVFGAVVVILALIGWRTFVWFTKHTTTAKGDLGPREERALRKLLDDAARVLSSLGVGPSIDDSDLLRPDSRTAVDDWLGRYDQFRKETERA